MVHALHEAARVLRAGGVLVDARPDARVRTRVEHAGRLVGTLGVRREERGDDSSAERAIAAVKGEGLFRARRAGRLWHRIAFDDFAALDSWLTDHPRFARRVAWEPGAAAERRARRGDRFTVVRPVRFEILERGSL